MRGVPFSSVAVSTTVLKFNGTSLTTVSTRIRYVNSAARELKARKKRALRGRPVKDRVVAFGLAMFADVLDYVLDVLDRKMRGCSVEECLRAKMSEYKWFPTMDIPFTLSLTGFGT